MSLEANCNIYDRNNTITIMKEDMNREPGNLERMYESSRDKSK